MKLLRAVFFVMQVVLGFTYFLIGIVPALVLFAGFKIRDAFEFEERPSCTR